ncbi:putative methyltransferase-domain-containing protein [Pelagophyceae sp. CCMP2097]|nr:putative methyltransferase-domain-containing protein [Pelagophyceae sp. CCMP2097]
MAALDLSYAELWGDGGATLDVGGGRCITATGSFEEEGWTEFGNEVWPGAKTLAAGFVCGGAHAQLVRGKRVLELGAGCGLPGLTAAACGAAAVTLTDLDEALPRLRRNAEANAAAIDASNPGATVDVQTLAWGAAIDAAFGGYDVVLASDVVYKPALVAPLVATLKQLLTRKAQVLILANDERSSAQKRFAGVLEASEFDVQTTHVGAVLVHVCRPLYDEAAAAPGAAALRFTHSSFSHLPANELVIQQDPKAVDGLGGTVWPNAVAMARWLIEASDYAGDVRSGRARVFELGCGTGATGLALAAAGAAHVTLTDEFVALAASNAAAVAQMQPANAAVVTVRRCRWGHANDADAADWKADATLPSDAIELVVGAELTPMLDGHEALAAEIERRLDSARHRGCRGVGLIACTPCADVSVCAAKRGRCRTHAFIDTAARVPHLRLARVIPGVAASRAGDADVANLDLTFDDGTDDIWILEFTRDEKAGRAS